MNSMDVPNILSWAYVNFQVIYKVSFVRCFDDLESSQLSMVHQQP